MRLPSFWPLLLLAAACVDVNNLPSDPLEPSTPVEPTPVNLGGIWSHTLNGSDLSSGMICTATGLMSLVQTADAVSGTYSVITACTDSLSQTIQIRSTGNVSGSLTGSALSLGTDNGCNLQGTLGDTTASFAQGQSFCNFMVGGSQIILEGSWQLTRSSSCGFVVVARDDELAALCALGR
ncbi:MAG: hypothetical protein QOH59_2833 [Gemmatimonadales bacterium]|jgi:hypothetical protein|nr:hypothetical protein [Gemmatimonadales bacterium]